MPSLRIGIIACSNVARRRFLPALVGAAHARLEHVGSRDRAKAQEFATTFNCGKHGSYDDVLADDAVDAVYISTPTPEHFHWAQRALEAGKHVLCEKPALTSVAEARQIVELAQCQQRRVMDGYMMRFHPQHARVRSLIAAGRIGPVRHVTGEFFYPRPPVGDIRLQPKLLGGVLHDSAGYPLLAASLALAARPTRVLATTDLDPSSGVDRHVAMFVEYPGGVTAQLAAGFDLPYRARYSVTGNLGRIEVERAYAVNADATTYFTVEDNAGTERIAVAPADQFRLMIEHFAAQALGHEPCDSSLETGLLDRQCQLAALQTSVREQRPVSIEYLS